MKRRKLVIAKGMTMLALLAALVLAGCGGQQPADDESASAEKARASTQEARASRPDGSEKSPTSSDVPQASEKESGSMTAPRMESGPVGDMIEIRKPLVQIRSAPSIDAPPIGLAFGNDTFTVLEQEGDWVRVRVGKRREGWISVEATRE